MKEQFSAKRRKLSYTVSYCELPLCSLYPDIQVYSCYRVFYPATNIPIHIHIIVNNHLAYIYIKRKLKPHKIISMKRKIASTYVL